MTKWTGEYVRSIPWKEKSTIEVLEASLSKWRFVLKVLHSIHPWRIEVQASTCPSCRKWHNPRSSHGCWNCPLCGSSLNIDSCCAGAWKTFNTSRTYDDAKDVVRFISARLRQFKRASKE